MSTGILSDILADILLIVDLLFPDILSGTLPDILLIVDFVLSRYPFDSGISFFFLSVFLLIVDLAIWFLDFGGKRKGDFSPFLV